MDLKIFNLVFMLSWLFLQMFFKLAKTGCAFPSLALISSPAPPIIVTVAQRYTNFSYPLQYHFPQVELSFLG